MTADMAAFVSTGSPRASRRSTPTVKVYDDGTDPGRTPTNAFTVSTEHRLTHIHC